MNSRILSALIALAYVAGSFFFDGGEAAFKVALFLILPLSCIWFSAAMGGYTGIGFGRGAITSPTPGCLVAAGGWLLLLLPAIMAIIMTIRGSI